MSIALQRPDNARARPSSLLKRDEDYLALFSVEHPIKMYYFCTTLMRRVEEHLRSKGTLEQKDRSNIKFHIAMYTALLAAGKGNLSKSELAGMLAQDIDNTILDASTENVLEIYKILGASDQVAKGPEFLAEIKKDIERRLK